MEEFLTFNAMWPWSWIGPYGTPSCITHQPLHKYQISFKSEKLFADRQTYVRIDGWTDIEACFIRWVDLTRNYPNYAVKSAAVSIATTGRLVAARYSGMTHQQQSQCTEVYSNATTIFLHSHKVTTTGDVKDPHYSSRDGQRLENGKDRRPQTVLF